MLDLDCPEIMRILLGRFPQLEVTRLSPVLDVEKDIESTAEACWRSGADLIVLVGGSGGGHRFSETLGRDFTHSALELWLEEKTSHEIYGKNGHMWSKLVCGRKGRTLVFNVPGPLPPQERICRLRDLLERLAEAPWLLVSDGAGPGARGLTLSFDGEALTEQRLYE